MLQCLICPLSGLTLTQRTTLYTQVHAARNEVILLLEKDFAILEKQRMIYWQLEQGVKMLQQEQADVIRYRHRFEVSLRGP